MPNGDAMAIVSADSLTAPPLPKRAPAARAAETVVVVPTLNAARELKTLLPVLAATDPAPRRVLVIDSDSDDETAALAAAAGCTVHCIRRSDFNHGGTRNLACRLAADASFIVFLTQDAVPVGPDWLLRLLAAFDDPRIALVHGRQLPHADATPAARFARDFNYPAESRTVAACDIAELGIKAAYCSNSFSAWRLDLLTAVGGFPEMLPLGEDMAAAMRLLQAGWRNHYEATAIARHSHNYSIGQEFRRYFDIGALLALDPVLRAARLSSGGAGRSFARAEIGTAFRASGSAGAAEAVLRNAGRWAGYALGRRHRLLPRRLCARLAMHAFYWRSP